MALKVHKIENDMVLLKRVERGKETDPIFIFLAVLVQ